MLTSCFYPFCPYLILLSTAKATDILTKPLNNPYPNMKKRSTTHLETEKCHKLTYIAFTERLFIKIKAHGSKPKEQLQIPI